MDRRATDLARGYRWHFPSGVRAGLVGLLAMSLGCDESTTGPPIPPPPADFLEACSVAGAPPALCGQFAVPEDHDAPGGREIQLNIIVVPAQTQPAAADPVVILQGGPGGAASSLADNGYNLSFPNRDLVFIDQRGTGQSNPLHCNDEASLRQVDIARVFEEGFPESHFRECLARLQGLADLTQYNTTAHVQDLELVLDALGYDRINLVGVSYGSYAAQRYMQMVPERLRAVILDAVAPVENRLFLGEGQFIEEGVAAIAQVCENDLTCHATYPDLGGKIDSLYTLLEAGPIVVGWEHPWTGASVDVPVSPATLATALRSLTRRGDRHAVFPSVIQKALDGDWQDVVSFAFGRNLLTTGTGIALGTYFSVICTEGMQEVTEAEVLTETSGTRLGDHYVRAFLGICDFWPVAPIPADLHTPVVSSIPTLVTSGALDGVTPKSAGDRVAAHLSNGRHLVSPFGGHGTGSAPGAGACFGAIASQFMAQASVDGLDVSCIAALQPPAFLSVGAATSHPE